MKHISKSNQSRSFEERKKRRLILGAVAGVVVIASWSFVFNKISFMPSLAINDVHIYGVEADVAPSLRAAVYRNLRGSYLGLLSHANAFLYPRSAIVAAVGEASARVDSVTITRDGLNSLNVSIIEKNPAAIACVGLPNFDDNGALVDDSYTTKDCYMTDENGLIFKKAKLDTTDTFNRYFVPDVIGEPVGSYATSTNKFKALQKFIGGVRASGITPEAILVKPAGEYELYVHNYAKNAAAMPTSIAIIYFNDATPFDTELSNLSAFWNSMNHSLKNKGASSEFEYIDVRYGSNVFYRLIQ